MRSSDAGRAEVAFERQAVSGGLLSTALATMVVLLLLALLLWVVAANALGWFWPARVWQYELNDGRVVVGEFVGRVGSAHGAHDSRSGERLRIKVGNREATGADHVWIEESDVVRATTPERLVRIERTAFGDAFGHIVSVTGFEGDPLDPLDERAVRSLVDRTLEAREELDILRASSARVRQPLTLIERRQAALSRSDHGRTPDGQRESQQLRREIAEVGARISPQLAEVEREIARIERTVMRGRLILAAGSLSLEVSLDTVMHLEWPNRMGPAERLVRAIKNGVRFLITEPREANMEGGIYPALFGTVLMVLLMSLAVMPLGVLTAVYMTEYASEGPFLRIAHHAVNNLAGVPSIVIGMFGLAFFVYGVGGGIDRALYDDRLPTPTFGTGGILWASLTLALLTVPVVVVATREGLQAVPRAWREGSLALGATRWQTLRSIVLPAAAPGMLTGLILAVSRAAGEVAPLMLTGAVKLTHALPLDGTPPFFHLQRKFMHLGFHIYDVSMQSPNVEAAKPMAFATTLVLLVLVVAINLSAILVRRRLRLRYRVLEI
jgi:phosphate transport system permease protein